MQFDQGRYLSLYMHGGALTPSHDRPTWESPLMHNTDQELDVDIEITCDDSYSEQDGPDVT